MSPEADHGRDLEIICMTTLGLDVFRTCNWLSELCEESTARIEADESSAGGYIISVRSGGSSPEAMWTKIKPQLQAEGFLERCEVFVCDRTSGEKSKIWPDGTQN